MVADISGVNDNQAEAPVNVCTDFYPVIQFEISMYNSDIINKSSKLFNKDDLLNEKRKSYLEEIKYEQLEEKYVVPYYGMTPSLTETRVFRLACEVIAGLNNCVQSGRIQMKMETPITGLSAVVVPDNALENAKIKSSFVIELTVTKDADISPGEFNRCPLIFTVSNEGKQDAEIGRINLSIEPELKQFIYLLGSSTYGTPYTFTQQMNLRKNAVLKARKTNEKYIFYSIDIPNGKILKYEYPGKTQGELFTDLGKFDPINQSNYINGRFASGTKTIISKGDVYKLIEKIGLESPNSVKEFAIFSHAYSKGPILVNSNERNPDGSINSDDHDMRVSDYKNINIASFKNAFCNDGTIYNLGCNSSPHLNNILKQIMNSSKYKSDGSNTDDIVFTLKDMIFGSTMISAFAGNYKKDLGNNKFEMTMLDLKLTMYYYFINTYAAYMAKFIDISVVASLPSTYSIFVDPVTNKPIEFRISDDTKNNTSFFSTYLDIEITKEKYGVFTKVNVENSENNIGEKIQ